MRQVSPWLLFFPDNKTRFAQVPKEKKGAFKNWVFLPFFLGMNCILLAPKVGELSLKSSISYCGKTEVGSTWRFGGSSNKSWFKRLHTTH